MLIVLRTRAHIKPRKPAPPPPPDPDPQLFYEQEHRKRLVFITGRWFQKRHELDGFSKAHDLQTAIENFTKTLQPDQLDPFGYILLKCLDSKY